MALSNDILHEYEEIISCKTNPRIALNVVELLSTLPNVQFQEVHFYWQLVVGDPDDNKFSDCYVRQVRTI